MMAVRRLGWLVLTLACQRLEVEPDGDDGGVSMSADAGTTFGGDASTGASTGGASTGGSSGTATTAPDATSGDPPECTERDDGCGECEDCRYGNTCWLVCGAGEPGACCCPPNYACDPLHAECYAVGCEPGTLDCVCGDPCDYQNQGKCDAGLVCVDDGRGNSTCQPDAGSDSGSSG
jgi:hypothetical protein